jgi:hypothetical protein
MSRAAFATEPLENRRRCAGTGLFGDGNEDSYFLDLRSIDVPVLCPRCCIVSAESELEIIDIDRGFFLSTNQVDVT